MYAKGGWIASQLHSANLLREAMIPYPASINHQPGQEVRLRRVWGKHQSFQILSQGDVADRNTIATCAECNNVNNTDVSCITFVSCFTGLYESL